MTPPSVLAVPTGAGKTQALVVSWLYQRLVRQTAPRRLVYALPMRTLVEQTEKAAREVLRRLGVAQEVSLHVLMGGEAATDWREHPERPQILVGTVDMLLSRALNRGYGESRFAWPVAFGLLNSDCRWVFDEVQLMGPARTTSAQLDGLRQTLGVSYRCETIWASATVDRAALQTVDRPELGPVLELGDDDRCGPLGERLTARKLVGRIEVDGPAAIAAAVLEHHVAAERTLVVVNRVQRAQEVHEALRRAGSPARLVLLHSRFRPPEREDRTAEALARPDGDAGTIVVATQVVEAGVDLSARVLAIETAPFSAVVQRCGRCNREAEHPEATVLWLDSGEPDAHGAAPYELDDLVAARGALLELVGQSASPEHLSSLDVREHRDAPIVLRRRDLLDLFDTAPDLSGLDLDVSGFIRDTDRRSVSVFFREGLQSGASAPTRDELVEVPIGELERTREAWVFDHLEGRWARPLNRDLRPGQVVMLDAAGGGYDPATGWRKGSRSPVPVVAPGGDAPEGMDDDPLTTADRWTGLREHLEAAADEAQAITSDDHWHTVVRATALHDIGKAHPAFQEMLLASVPDGERTERTGEVWAKSAGSRGKHIRPHFRHELASALALLEHGEEDLVTYLVAAHHGRVRLALRPAPDEQDEPGGARVALGVHDGDELPAVSTPVGELPRTRLDLEPMELGSPRSWSELTAALRDRPDLGPFRLGYLEALVRIADWRASQRA